MRIKLNNEDILVSEDCITVSELLALKEIPTNGTAVAVNDHLVIRSQWASKHLNENDNVVIISAAYGG